MIVPRGSAQELSIQEIEKTFRSMGRVYFFNLSGGCPFLRKDLPEIVRLACRHLHPQVIHIPTNGLIPEEVLRQTTAILQIIHHLDRNISLQIKPSLDGIGPEQDRIRGVKGNFEKIQYLLKELKKLQAIYPQLHIGVGTTLSTLNLSSLPEILAYVEGLQVDSYITEIAEVRRELLNREMSLTPSARDYQQVVPLLTEMARREWMRKRGLTRVTQAFRAVYYPLVAEILRERRQVIPCYAGISNAHLSPYGELWPCCVLGEDQPLGNLRDAGYDFGKVWHSSQARQVREFIRQGRCYCPLANQSYANILCHGKKLLQATLSFLRDRTPSRVLREGESSTSLERRQGDSIE